MAFISLTTQQKNQIANYLQIPAISAENLLRAWCSGDVGGPSGSMDVVIAGEPFVEEYVLDPTDTFALAQKRATITTAHVYNIQLNRYADIFGVTPEETENILGPYLINTATEYGVIRLPNIINICVEGGITIFGVPFGGGGGTVTGSPTTDNTPSVTVTVTPNVAVPSVGDTIEFIASVRDNLDRDVGTGNVSWESSDPTVVDISGKNVSLGTTNAIGSARILKQGSVVIYATFNSSQLASYSGNFQTWTGTATVTAIPGEQPNFTVTLQPNISQSIYRDGYLPVTASVTDASGNNVVNGSVEFISLDRSIVIVGSQSSRQDGVTRPRGSFGGASPAPYVYVPGRTSFFTQGSTTIIAEYRSPFDGSVLAVSDPLSITILKNPVPPPQNIISGVRYPDALRLGRGTGGGGSGGGIGSLYPERIPARIYPFFGEPNASYRPFGNYQTIPNEDVPIVVTFEEPLALVRFEVDIYIVEIGGNGNLRDYFQIDSDGKSVASKNVIFEFLDEQGNVLNRRSIAQGLAKSVDGNSSVIGAVYIPPASTGTRITNIAYIDTINPPISGTYPYGTVQVSNTIKSVRIFSPSNYDVTYLYSFAKILQEPVQDRPEETFWIDCTDGQRYSFTQRPRPPEYGPVRTADGDICYEPPVIPTWVSCIDGNENQGNPPSDYVEIFLEDGSTCWLPGGDITFTPSLSNLQFTYQRGTARFPAPLNFTAQNISDTLSYEVMLETNPQLFTVNPSKIYLGPGQQTPVTVSIKNEKINEFGDGRTRFTLKVDTFQIGTA